MARGSPDRPAARRAVAAPPRRRRADQPQRGAAARAPGGDGGRRARRRDGRGRCRGALLGHSGDAPPAGLVPVGDDADFAGALRRLALAASPALCARLGDAGRSARRGGRTRRGHVEAYARSTRRIGPSAEADGLTPTAAPTARRSNGRGHSAAWADGPRGEPEARRVRLSARYPGRPSAPRLPTTLGPTPTEGTYPFEGGGVTSWADVVLRGLPESDVHLLAVTGSSALGAQERAAAHVRSVQTRAAVRRRRADRVHATLPSRSRRRCCAASSDGAERRRAPVRAALPALSRRWSARGRRRGPARGCPRPSPSTSAGTTTAPRSARAPRGDAFRDWSLAGAALDGEAEPSLGDLVQALRWVYNFLLPITVPVPQTDVTHATLAGFGALAGVVAQQERGVPLIVDRPRHLPARALHRLRPRARTRFSRGACCCA